MSFRHLLIPVVAAVALAGCGPSTPPTATAPPTASASPSPSPGPAGRAVWVVSHGPGESASDVHVVDIHGDKYTDRVVVSYDQCIENASLTTVTATHDHVVFLCALDQTLRIVDLSTGAVRTYSQRSATWPVGPSAIFSPGDAKLAYYDFTFGTPRSTFEVLDLKSGTVTPGKSFSDAPAYAFFGWDDSGILGLTQSTSGTTTTDHIARINPVTGSVEATLADLPGTLAIGVSPNLKQQVTARFNQSIGITEIADGGPPANQVEVGPLGKPAAATYARKDTRLDPVIVSDGGTAFFAQNTLLGNRSSFTVQLLSQGNPRVLATVAGSALHLGLTPSGDVVASIEGPAGHDALILITKDGVRHTLVRDVPGFEQNPGGFWVG